MEVSQAFLISLLDARDKRKLGRMGRKYQKDREALKLNIEKKPPGIFGGGMIMWERLKQHLDAEKRFINECLVRYALERNERGRRSR